MRRTLLKIITGLVVAGLLLSGLVTVGLPLLLGTRQFQDSFRSAASEALHSSVDWRRIRVGFLPLRLILDAATFRNQSVDAEQARLAAASVEFRLGLLPILQGRLQVDSLVLRDLDLLITRTEAGLILPVGAGAVEPETDSAGQTPDQGAGFDLAFSRLVIVGGRVILRDQTRQGTEEWRLEDFDFEAHGESIEAPIDIELTAQLHSGSAQAGAVAVRGAVSIGGVYDLDVELDRIDLERLQPYLSDFRLGGRLSGRVALSGTRDGLSAAEVNLELAELTAPGVGRGRSNPELRPIAGSFNVSGTLLVVAESDLDGFVELDLGLSSSGAGRLGVQGISSQEGSFDLDLTLDRFDLALVQALISDPEIEVGGRGTGTGRFVGPVRQPRSIALAIEVEAGLFRMPEYRIDGPFRFDLQMEEPFSRSPRGRLALDLTDATLEYADQFKKRAGSRAQIVTEFVPDESGVTVLESRIKLQHVDEILRQGRRDDSKSIAVR